ncbi:tetratricopeptide repeat-containing sensor histidine kinase [Polaribacter sp. SA4-12]|uniref:tetratricopeptide repeat-containing sensor histidine kinase n=1 Tax=Polaribacter sp. SA4-12 TaxID=1312072 RepID=UPI001E2A97E4|nr:ATP-binding protein [Polaribacter sp. SA4-12]
MIFFHLSTSCLFSFTKEEVVSNTTSSFVFQNYTLSENYKKAKIFYENKDYANSLRLALKISESDNPKNEVELILLNHLIANIYYATRNNKNALVYHKKTLNYLKEFNLSVDKNEINSDNITYFDKDYITSETLLNYGNAFYRLNIRDNIKRYKDSALYYYNEVDKINTLKNNVLEVKSKAYNNISSIYMNDSLYEKAKYYAIKSIGIHKKINNKVNEAAALGTLSSIYLSENNFAEAKKTYINALDLIRNIKTDKAVLVREKLYFNLAYNLYKLKDYKAYDYQELSYIIKDSLRDNEFRGMIAEITEKYNFDNKKELFQKQEENKRLKDQRIFWMIGIGAFIIILSLLFWVNFYKLKQKNLRLKLSQSKLIQNQNLEKVRSESQVRILNATIDGKETERKQIAETLHDSVSALLSSANLHLQATRSQLKGDAPIEIDKTQKIITEASQKIRDLSHTLVSSVLLKFGLKFAINDMADKYSNSQIEIDTKIGETRRYHQDFEIKVYNITQEFVNNILKHSKAEKAVIRLDEVNGKLSLKITDDGVGFDKTKITNKDGLGLNQIDARIQMMQGTFNIDSTKKQGTVIKVVLPILEKDGINLA